jgi:hypothetical protein
VALQYARTLVNNSSETRAELFHRVGTAAVGLAVGAPTLQFAPWQLAALGRSFTLWPWSIVPPERVETPRTHFRQAGISGQDRPPVLAPRGAVEDWPKPNPVERPRDFFLDQKPHLMLSLLAADVDAHGERELALHVVPP